MLHNICKERDIPLLDEDQPMGAVAEAAVPLQQNDAAQEPVVARMRVVHVGMHSATCISSKLNLSRRHVMHYNCKQIIL